MSHIGRVLINFSELRRVPVDPNDVDYLEAVGDDTLVRMRSKRRGRDLRALGPGLLPAHHRSECAGQDPHGSVSHTCCHKRVSRRRGRLLDNMSVLTYTSFE